MKLTVKTSDVLNDIYATSALIGQAHESPNSYSAFILSPLNRAALEQVLDDAFATLIASELDSCWEVADADDGYLAIETDREIKISEKSATKVFKAILVRLVLLSIYGGPTIAATSLERDVRIYLRRLNPIVKPTRIAPDL